MSDFVSTLFLFTNNKKKYKKSFIFFVLVFFEIGKDFGNEKVINIC